MATEREWLATQGLAIAGARGRLSKLSHTALEDAKAKGMKFDTPAYAVSTRNPSQGYVKKVERIKPLPGILLPAPVKPVQVAVRTQAIVRFVTEEGYVIEQGSCGGCHYSFKFCKCSRPVAPSIAVALAKGESFDKPFTFKEA